MNLSALKTLTERLADDGFTIAQEKLIAHATVDEKIQPCDIIEALLPDAKHYRYANNMLTLNDSR